MEAAVAAFGPDRLILGSDWPVCRLVSSYREVIDATESLVARLSETERSAVLGGTASRVYGIEAPAG